MGHSYNDRTRVSAALLSSNDGNVNLAAGTNSYSGFIAASQAFDTGKLGVQRVGVYAMVGEAPITYLTSGGVPVLGTGTNKKSFHREGFVGLFYFGKLDFLVVTQHGWDNVWFGQGYGSANNPSNGTAGAGTGTGLNCVPLMCTLPTTARAPTWNGYMVETHYVYSPQLIFIQRSEWERMSQQALTHQCLEPGEHRYVHDWISLLSNHDQPGRFCLAQRVLMVPAARNMRRHGTDLTNSSLLLGFDFDF